MNVNALCQCGSGKTFGDCHATYMPPNAAPVGPSSVVYAGRTVTRKLDLASGQAPAPGFEGVDLWPGSEHVVDLQVYPWPFEDCSVLELRCSHYIEHIPMEYVDASGTPCRVTSPGAKDALLRFFDEAWRVLVPDGILTTIAPCAASNRAFQDPTHRRFIPPDFYAYLNRDWRVGNKLDHYGVDCHFVDNGVIPILHPNMNLQLKAMTDEAAMARVTHERNVIMDWQATLRAVKAASP